MGYSGAPENGSYRLHDRPSAFLETLQDAGLPVVRIHDLRHSCASYLLGKGVPIHVVSALLGHSRVSTTLDIYSHCLPAQQHDAVTAAWATL